MAAVTVWNMLAQNSTRFERERAKRAQNRGSGSFLSFDQFVNRRVKTSVLAHVRCCRVKQVMTANAWHIVVNVRLLRIVARFAYAEDCRRKLFAMIALLFCARPNDSSSSDLLTATHVVQELFLRRKNARTHREREQKFEVATIFVARIFLVCSYENILRAIA